MIKNNDPKKTPVDQTLKSEEQMVCSQEFAESCVEVEMDVEKGLEEEES